MESAQGTRPDVRFRMQANAPTVTAVLLSYSRQRNIPKIVERLSGRPWIGRVIIWDNAGDLRCDGAAIIRSPVNMYTYGRIIASRMADGLVYTQDDDVLPDADWLDELRDSFDGQSIAHGLSKRHHRLENPRWAHLGWGAIYDRSWVRVAGRYLRRYGRDDLLLRKADKVFTVLHGKRRPVVARYRELPGARDATALYRRRDHRKLDRDVLYRCRAILGEIRDATGADRAARSAGPVHGAAVS